ncbi:hypothetical protein ABZR88_11035 [Mucilaginibacter yixingensis]|uniref:hypothetical protein n=1 Tax=Mucilaginibacter yixingensis TaxID=1295612 RepID=UPI000D305469|nr:hypothetical protein [Mucilaginibacter yixingensis]
MPVDRPNNIFRSLDAKTCKTVYPKVRENADRHFKAAEVLAAVGDLATSYPFGVYRLIIAQKFFYFVDRVFLEYFKIFPGDNFCCHKKEPTFAIFCQPQHECHGEKQ